MAFDPTATLGEDDPLRAWAAENLDPVTGAMLVADPSKAIDAMIEKGVPPPTQMSPLGYADPAGGSDTGGAPPVFTPGGKMQGNLTSSQGQPPVAVPPLTSTPAATPTVVPQGSPFDPTPDAIPLPQPRPVEAGPGASDISAAKKPSTAEALGDFSKSLVGVRPVAPPALNAVGTPSVRSPSAVGAPNIQALLQMIGQQNNPTALSTLGRLLVAGKA